MPSAHPKDTNAAAVKQEARRQGFDACGIAEAVFPDPEDTLGVWLRAGYHADMKWMAQSREIRQNVQRKLPGAKSVIVVARNYFAKRPQPSSGEGLVSRYAWGRDYHRVLCKPLRRLASFVNSLEPETRSYFSIDAGPVLEKVWAARAGVGWIGKNSLALRRGMGSWFFLGTILTTLELAPDSPLPDQCGSCRACIDACPTQAIVAPGTVDARRCISYHTIENRGDIPRELHKDFGAWAFGCDICQEVCPYNRNPLVTTEADFHPRPGHASLSPESVAAMDEAAFQAEFSGTPLMRAKLAGLKRNTRIVKENRRITDTLNELGDR